MQKWLARLSFSLLIIAAVLVWEIYKMTQTGAEDHRVRFVIYCIAAGACAALGMAGVRARHRWEE